jgi:hypothetical protein
MMHQIRRTPHLHHPVDRIPRRSPVARGLALPEAATALAAATLAVAVAVPTFAMVRGDARVGASLDNLRALGAAHVSYAADWNDRQFTAINDDISAYADNALGINVFNAAQGGDRTRFHPPVTLGWGPPEGGGAPFWFAYRTSQIANARFCEPIVFSGINFQINGFFGSFRVINDARFTPYVGGRFYDSRFHAPTDAVVWPLVEPLSQEPWEFIDTPSIVGFGDGAYWSSYSTSAAAMFDPAVMAPRRLEDGVVVGGWSDPWTTASGFRSPAMSQARYPGLKTHMLEHHWLQNPPPEPCNPDAPFATYDGCEPYYFNHGFDSSPATLFYDGSTRLLPNADVVASDEIVRRGSGGDGFDGLWSRTTPFGENGYFNELSVDGISVSHHVLTAGGILGRDTLEPGMFDAPRGGHAEARATSTTASSAAERAAGRPSSVTRALRFWTSQPVDNRAGRR